MDRKLINKNNYLRNKKFIGIHLALYMIIAAREKKE